MPKPATKKAAARRERRGVLAVVPAALPPPPWELAVSETAWQVPVLRLKTMRWIRFMEHKALVKSATQKSNQLVHLETSMDSNENP
jgi:hypothetical protein